MTRSIRFGGTSVRSVAPRRQADPLRAVLGALSWKYVTDKPTFKRQPLATKSPQELKEDIAHWVGRVWCHENTPPAGTATRTFDIMSLKSQFLSYVRARGQAVFEEGLTLEEIWVSQQLYSATPMVAIVASPFKDLITTRMGDLANVQSSDAIVWTLGAMCFWQAQAMRAGFNVLVSDGRIGHTIRISGVHGIDFRHSRGVDVSAGWLSFHDPWPARSLLAPERDFAGVRALEDVTRPPRWLIHPADLNKIIVGYVLAVDILPAFSRIFATLDAAQRAYRGSRRPLWQDDPNDDRPFGSLFASERIAPFTSDGLLGLGRFRLLERDVDGAIECFQGAAGLGGPAARLHAAELLLEAGYEVLAREWRE